MIDYQTLTLVVVFFVTSGISVITGSTSLITVPVMLQFGINPKTAVATNMLALLFMSAGGTIPFLTRRIINTGRLLPILGLTVVGSACGAYLLVVAPQGSIPVIVSLAMIGIAVFSIVHRQAGISSSVPPPSRVAETVGLALTFVLGIYGGFFSGGYVTLLTALYVVCFRMQYLEAIAVTKLANVVSSGVSVVIFARHGMIDYRLGFLLGATMFVGALIGSRFAIRVGNVWLRRIYLTAVWLLGLKVLVFDVLAREFGDSIRPHHSVSLPE